MKLRRSSSVAAAGALLMGGASGALAQSTPLAGPRVEVVASKEFDRSEFWRFWFGEDWRDVWSARISAPVLDLGTFAGGLEPFKEGGNQSKTLRFHGGDGRTYIFRSTQKSVVKTAPEDISKAPLGKLMQDQNAAFHPTAPLVVSRLQEAVGLLFAPPTLVFIPDDKRLGKFRKDFANTLGQIEERPDESERGPTFAGADKIISSEKLIENLETSMENAFDSRDYLKARLLDFIIGDTDRGGDQWRFALFKRGERGLYRPIPRDRDYAFMRVEGVVMGPAKGPYGKLARYGPDFPNLHTLTFMTREFDRSHLIDLPWSSWESIVTGIQQALTDKVIDEAIMELPPAHRQLSGALLRSGLRSRRDHLPAIAREYYLMVNEDAAIFTSDERERAEITRHADGSVTVKVWRQGEGGELATNGTHTPVFDRHFVPEETKEIRIYLERGDDRAIVQGRARHSIKVRVVGGEGDDVLIDSSYVSDDNGARFYDATGNNTIVPGPNTHVSTKHFDAGDQIQLPDDEVKNPEKNPRLINEERRGRFRDLMAKGPTWISEKTAPGLRTWGSTSGWSPMVDFHHGVGLIVGYGPTFTKYGFRRAPYESQIRLRGMVGATTGDLGVELSADKYLENSRWGIGAVASATQLDPNRFFGFGNDTEFIDDNSLTLINNNQLKLHAFFRYTPSPSTSVSFGPVVKYVDPDIPEGSPADILEPAGSAPFGQVGGRADIEIDETVMGPAQQSGFGMKAGASVYPGVWNDAGAFGEVHGVARLFIPLKLPTIAFRVGGQKVWGDFPFEEAAFIGGRRSLRGFAWNRFAGDLSAYGSVELHVPITRITLFTRGQLGAIAFTDAGRVWFRGDSPDNFHTSVGGGLWFSSLGQTASVVYAKGEQGRVYFSLGHPF